MGPLRKYYLSFAAVVFIGLAIAGIGPGRVRIAGVVVVLIVAAYMAFVRCPKCGTRLSTMGLPP